MLSNCDGEPWTAALLRLYRMPVPHAPAWRLAPVVPREASEQGRYELDVFFDHQVPYPPAIVFGKLDGLLMRLKSTHSLLSIRITGSVDQIERQQKIASTLATTRAARVQDYLRSGAGTELPIELAVAEPSHGETPEGRALDRVARISVVALRAKDPGARQ